MSEKPQGQLPDEKPPETPTLPPANERRGLEYGPAEPHPPKSNKSWRIMMFCIAILGLALDFGVGRATKKLTQINNIQGTAGYWVPTQLKGPKGFTAALMARFQHANTILVMTSVFGDRQLADELNAARTKGAEVGVIVDGTGMNGEINIKNRAFYQNHGFAFMLTKHHTNLNMILIDGRYGWMATGPFNAQWRTSEGRLFQLSSRQCAMLSKILQQRITDKQYIDGLNGNIQVGSSN